MIRDSEPFAVMITGGGSTAEALRSACASGRLNMYKLAVVIRSNSNAGGKIYSDDVKFELANPRDFETPEAFGDHILGICDRYGVKRRLGQCGWLPETPPNVLEAFPEMWNQHPGPIDPPDHPGFGGQGMYGKRVHAAVLGYHRAPEYDGSDMWTEATAQLVGAGYDSGKLLMTKRLDIREQDDLDTLPDRLLPLEHELQIELLEAFAAGTVEPFVRTERLIPSRYTQLLADVKAYTKRLYPDPPRRRKKK